MYSRTSLALCIAYASLLPLSSMAESQTTPPLSPHQQLGKLIKEIVPGDGPVRPPYDLARHDMGFKKKLRDWDSEHPWPKKAEDNESVIREHAILKQQALRNWARTRQLRLIREWRSLKKSWGREKRQTERSAADYTFLRYAFGELPLDAFQIALQTASPDCRLRAARLLLAECRFDAAARNLIRLSNEDNPRWAPLALALLVRLDEERRAIARKVPLMPLAVDLEEHLTRKSRKAEIGALIQRMRQIIVKKSPPIWLQLGAGGLCTEGPVRDVYRESVPVEAWDRLFESEVVFAEGRIENWLSRVVEPRTLNTPYFELDTTDLLLTRASGASSRIVGTEATFELNSRYGGAMDLRLYRFEKKEVWESVAARTLSKYRPDRAWQKHYHPLSHNNSGKTWHAKVKVDKLTEGYYLLLIGARYAPMVAAQKFAVSRVALYLRAARNKGVVVAVDRSDGRPVGDVPVVLRVQGSPVISSLKKRYKGDHRDAFLAGLHGRDLASRSDAGPLTPSILLAQAKAHDEGMKLSRRYPKVDFQRAGRTDASGTLSFDLDIGREDYAYTLHAKREEAGLAEASVHYREGPAPKDQIKVVMWGAQPVYRPGATANLKGIVRRFNGLRIASHDNTWKRSVEVIIKNEKRRLCTKKCELSEAGTFELNFRIPVDSDLGTYQAYVDGTKASPWGPLSVQEFRLPTFRVKASPSRHTHRGGEVATGKVSVFYATGKPAADAEVEVVLETGEIDPPRADLATGQDGTAEFSFKLPHVKQRKSFTIRATVMDASGESYSGTGYLGVTPTPFDVDVTVSPNPAVQGSPIEVKVKAMNWDGTPVKNALVSLQGETRVVRTDAKGKACLPTHAASRGRRQELHLSVVTKLEAVHETARVNLRPRRETTEAKTQATLKPAHRDHLSLDAPWSIKSGDTLAIGLDVDHRQGKACTVAVFVENTRMLAHRTVMLKPGKHTLEFPTDENYCPSIHVWASFLTGSNEHNDQEKCYVAPVHRFLNLEISTNKEDYKPGEPCRVELLALDHRKQPVPNAEISLGIVNRRVYWVREDPTPDLRNFFYRFRLPIHAKGRFDSPPPGCPPMIFWKGPKYAWGYLEAHQGEVGLFGARGAGGRRRLIMRGGGGKATEGNLNPRRTFKNTAHWVANLITDGEGRARTSFTWPDDITSWRFTARGVTPNTMVGQVSLSRRTMLPLQVELSLPRGLRTGDRVSAGAIIHNNEGPARQVRVQFSALDAHGDQTVKVGQGGAARVPVALAPQRDGRILVTAKARDPVSAEGDAIERQWPVLPRGHRATRSFAGTFTEGGTIPLDLGGTAIPGSLRLTVNAESGFSGPVNAALGELIAYPYGCVEQTMSRFLPAVIVAKAMQKAGVENPRASELNTILAKGLARLRGFQHTDGGWGWWEKDKTNDFMTAYVLEGLALCRASGQSAPVYMIDRAERYLSKRLADGTLNGGAVGAVGQVRLEVFAAHALALAYKLNKKTRSDQIRRTIAVLDDTLFDDEGLAAREYALAANAYLALGQRGKAKECLEQAVNKFQLSKPSRKHVLTAASLLEAGKELDPRNPRWLIMSRKLVKMRRGPAWSDTLVSAAAVRGLSTMLTDSASERIDMQVLLDGQVAASLSPRPNECVSISLHKELTGARQVVLRPSKRLKSDAFWSASLEGYLIHTPRQPADPDTTLSLKVSEVRPKDKEIEVATDGVLSVERGQTLKIKLMAHCSHAATALRLSVPRPCGVEMIRAPHLVKGIVAWEQRDDAFHFFVDDWKAGKHEIEFLVRAEVAGRVFAPWPELASMYGQPLTVKVEAPTEWVVR